MSEPKLLTNLIAQSNVFSLCTTRQYLLDQAFRWQSALKNKTMVTMKQVHSAEHVWLTKEHLTTGKRYLIQRNVDALVTEEKNVVLIAKAADCLPILIYHPKPLIAAIHAGRRGTEQGILFQTLTAIKAKTGLTSGFSLWFGPCICAQCYQIDPVTDLHFDLIQENIAQLKKAIPDNPGANLKLAQLCTAGQPDLFYSYRRDGKTGRMHALIMLQ